MLTWIIDGKKMFYTSVDGHLEGETFHAKVTHTL
jgi:hypothetical protein